MVAAEAAVSAAGSSVDSFECWLEFGSRPIPSTASADWDNFVGTVLTRHVVPRLLEFQQVVCIPVCRYPESERKCLVACRAHSEMRGN